MHRSTSQPHPPDGSVDVVGIYEAKTNFTQLVSRVESGLEVLITRHGRPVARLVPVPDQGERRRTLEELRTLRSRMDPRPLTLDELQEWIREGRA